MRVLLVEDDPALGDSVAAYLRRSSFAVDVAMSGEAALVCAGRAAYDAIVLDIGLPGMDGLQVYRQLRAAGCHTRVLMATARDAVDDRVRGRDLGSFVAEVKRRTAEEVALPPGMFLEWGGQYENQQRAMGRLRIVVPAALLLIFLLLFAAFRSVAQSGLVLLNVPFALVGGIAALWLRGLNLNLSASVGFIALFGIAVLNGVVLVSHLDVLRARGRPLDAAIREGAADRLRPVLMTALVASLGFVPMALSSSPGSEVQRPLATVVIGGLVTSTTLTLFLLPALYGMLGRAQARRARSAARDGEGEAPGAELTAPA